MPGIDRLRGVAPNSGVRKNAQIGQSSQKKKAFKKALENAQGPLAEIGGLQMTGGTGRNLQVGPGKSPSIAMKREQVQKQIKEVEQKRNALEKDLSEYIANNPDIFASGGSKSAEKDFEQKKSALEKMVSEYEANNPDMFAPGGSKHATKMKFDEEMGSLNKEMHDLHLEKEKQKLEYKKQMHVMEMNEHHQNMQYKQEMIQLNLLQAELEWLKKISEYMLQLSH